MSNRLSVKIGDLACQVMQLDDMGMLADFKVEADYGHKRYTVITGAPAALADLMNAFKHRADANGGWDQPASWTRAAAGAVVAIKKVLDADNMKGRLKRREGRAPSPDDVWTTQEQSS